MFLASIPASLSVSLCFVALNITFMQYFSIRKADEPSTSYSVHFQFLVRLWMAKPCLREQSFEIWDLLKTG